MNRYKVTFTGSAYVKANSELEAEQKFSDEEFYDLQIDVDEIKEEDMKKQDFETIAKIGIARNKQFMVVKIKTEGNPGPEIIINGSENFGQKLSYYLGAYNDDMELIKAKESGKIIKIVDVLMTSNLNDLSWFAY